ncbi:MAG: choice-of-anchor Q domain-containing protein [Gammaproteobacteria bacterium]
MQGSTAFGPSRCILAVFQEELARSPAGIGRRDPALRPRFVAHYRRLARLPRKARRALQRRWRRSLAGIALWCALGQIPAAPAAPIDVGVGGCTLVDAITAANEDAAAGSCPAGSATEPDTITLPAGSTQPLTLIDNSTYGPTGLPVVTSVIVIDGNGSTIGRVPATPEFRILAIGSGGDLTLQETSVTGGVIPSGSLYENGGGIINYGTLALTACTVSDNFAYNGGGGVHSSGVSTLTHSTVSNNMAMVSGGVSNHGVLTLANSTISGNFANSRGGGVFNNVYAMMTVTNSTISGNTAYNDGGGVLNSGILHLSSSTVSGNSAGPDSDSGYGGYLGKGGGVFNSYGTLTLVQTLVSGNSASLQDPEVYSYSGESPATIITDGFNLFGHDGSAGIGGFVPGVTDIVPTLPLTAILDPLLGDNGGRTRTHALVAGSPAIDAVPAASCATTGDQSGIMRPQDGDGDTVADCDIGALEPRIPAPTPPGATPANRKLRCTRSVCRVLLRCDLTQGSGTPCNSAVHILVPADASRRDGDRAAPKSILFASGLAPIEPGQIANVRIKLTKRGRRIVRTTTRTTLRGRLQIHNPAGTLETRVKITLRR